jgi:hypothetical protein
VDVTRRRVGLKSGLRDGAGLRWNRYRNRGVVRGDRLVRGFAVAGTVGRDLLGGLFTNKPADRATAEHFRLIVDDLAYSRFSFCAPSWRVPTGPFCGPRSA